jgi:hypothetical protein
VRALRLERLLFGWGEVEYLCPAVALETHTPIRNSGLLFEMRFGLARCTLKHWDRRRVIAALERASLTVIEARHSGSEAPVACMSMFSANTSMRYRASWWLEPPAKSTRAWAAVC